MPAPDLLLLLATPGRQKARPLSVWWRTEKPAGKVIMDRLLL
jgi:hypothetical protein